MFACEPTVISFGIRNNFHLMTAAEFAAKRLILCYGFQQILLLQEIKVGGPPKTRFGSTIGAIKSNH